MTNFDTTYWICDGILDRARDYIEKLERRIAKKGLTGIGVRWDDAPTFRIKKDGAWVTSSDSDEPMQFSSRETAQAMADSMNARQYGTYLQFQLRGREASAWRTVVEGMAVRIWADEVPSLSGWELAARTTHYVDADTGQDVNVFDAVPGVEVPEKYRNAGRDCEHCGYKRLRKNTFICRNEETGEWIQVGSNCLRDFLGVDPTRVLGFYEFFKQEHLVGFDSPDEERWPIRPEHTDPLDTVLLWCAYTVLTSRHVGMGDIRANDEPTTASKALATLSFMNAPIINDRGGRQRAEKARIRQWMEDHQDELQERIDYAKDWVRGLTEDSTFANNQKALLAAREVQLRHWGMVSYWCAKARHEAQAERRARAADAAAQAKQDRQDAAARQAAAMASRMASGHVGVQGERMVLEGVEVLSMRTFDGEFGEGKIVKLRMGDDRLVWFGSGRTVEKLEVGKVYDLKATIKGHSDDPKWGKETKVNRVAVVRVHEEVTTSS